MTSSAILAMGKAGTPSEIIYGYVTTKGLFITAENRHFWSERDLAEWDAVIAGYLSGKGLH